MANRKRILYVEDTPDNRDVVTQMLGSMYDILTAVNGEDGLAMALEDPPDLILMDVSLPVMDGLTCTRRMRETDVLREVPIVALTAHCMVGDREKALDAGCTDFMAKPFRFAQLREMVRRHLGS